jgi:hypothetical protein
MALSDYTTNNAIRLLLGVADDELEDTMLAEQTVMDNLSFELSQLAPTLDTDYQTAKAASPQTAPQSDLCAKVRLFATAAVAVSLLPSLPLMAPRTILHEKDSVERNLNAYQDTMQRVKLEYDRFKLALAQAYVTYQGQVITPPKLRVFMGVGSPNADPVVGS